MPKKPPPYSKLTLNITGERITADRFKRAVESFFGLIDEVTASLTGSSKSIEWIVSVKSGSIELGAVGEPKKMGTPVAAVVSATFGGLKQLQTSSRRPAHFTDGALADSRDLAGLVDGKAVRTVQVGRSNSHFQVQEKAVNHIDQILGGTSIELGTIEGRLQMISSRGPLRVGVWESLDDKLVRCFLPASMMDDAKAALDRRVAVFGTIRYRADGTAVSIEVEDLDVFPADSELPSADDVYGILSLRR